jgi:hypothetical protein
MSKKKIESLKQFLEKVVSVNREMPGHFDFIKAAVDVAWAYHHDRHRSITLDDETIPTLMREARNRCESLEKDFDALTSRNYELEKRFSIKKKAA